MNFKNRIITALGGVPRVGGEISKETNSVRGDDFLRFGNRGKSLMSSDWGEVKISDEDVYRGYPYAVIQKRANKVASLAKENLNTWVKPEALDYFQKKNQDPYHPYLKLIEDSTDFSTKQFWKTICIYLDLAGAFYLGVIRNKIVSKSLDKKNFPDIYGDVSKFVLLNPYEIKRVVNTDGEIAGYLETKKDGRQREWPPYMIIPMRELNPFDYDKVWSMTDAAKEETYTLNQSGNFTRETLKGNLNAPGILTTDVILDDQKFADFVERVRLHTKGEPIYGNGTGAITWQNMQTDLDRAALSDINEISRTALFAVSGTSKTALGIEQSGTTRETARVQTEQFIADTAQPRLEDIIDYLNLDYKKHYRNEYDKVGYWLEIQSAASRDYATETQAVQMRQAQSALAFDLMQKGYTMNSSYDYAEGKIELSELELEKGIDKPQNPEQPEAPEEPQNPPKEPKGPDDTTLEPDDETEEIQDESKNALANLEGLEPHSELIENGGKGSGNFGHAGREGERGGSAPKGVKAGRVRHQSYQTSPDIPPIEWEEADDPIYLGEIFVKSKDQIGQVLSAESASKAKTAYAVRDGRVMDPFRNLDPNDELDKHDIDLYRDYLKSTFSIDDAELDRLVGNTRKKVNSLEEAHDHTNCDCGKVEVLINELGESDGETLRESYKKFLDDIEEIQKETYRACLSKLNNNAFTEDDIIGKVKKQHLTNKLKTLIQNYWWILVPLLANSVLDDRNDEYNENVKFVFTNALQNQVEDNASRVAEGHIETILDDVLSATNKAYDEIVEDKAAELIVKAFKDNPEGPSQKFLKYFEEAPTIDEAKRAIRNTDILEENRKIYERANKLALEGYKREDIIKKIRGEYNQLSEKRALLIARNETSRAYGHAQYEADTQFLNSVGQLETAYKEWYSLRPDNEKDKICPFCQQMIDMGPIPFTQNFVNKGDVLTAEKNGKVYNFVCNYEDIKASTLHPNCMCRYRLILKNGKVNNEIVSDSPNDNLDSSDDSVRSNSLSAGKVENGGKGSGNFGHSGRPGEVGGSGKKGYKYGTLPDYSIKPKEGYTVLYTNTKASNLDSINEKGLLVGQNMAGYKASPEEGMGIWTDVRSPESLGYGGCTIAFQVPEEDAKTFSVNSHQCLIPYDIKRENILFIDKAYSDGPMIKASNIMTYVDKYGKEHVTDVLVRAGNDKEEIESLISAYEEAKKKKNSLEGEKSLPLVKNGGKGSGNFGHSGRPGLVGGSGDGKDIEPVDKIRQRVRSLDDESYEWLRDYCPRETWEILSNALDKAEQDGVDLSNINLRIYDIEDNGTASYHEPTESVNITLRRDLLLNSRAEQARLKAHGPHGSKTFATQDVEGIIIHELGHALNYQLVQKIGKKIAPNMDAAFNRVAGYIIETAKANIMGTKLFEQDNWSDKEWSMWNRMIENKGFRYMSDYATENLAECFAEAYANPNYSKLTKEINKVMKEKITVKKMADYLGIDVKELEKEIK